jgi:hypothetical protein
MLQTLYRADQFIEKGDFSAAYRELSDVLAVEAFSTQIYARVALCLLRLPDVSANIPVARRIEKLYFLSKIYHKRLSPEHWSDFELPTLPPPLVTWPEERISAIAVEAKQWLDGLEKKEP